MQRKNFRYRHHIIYIIRRFTSVEIVHFEWHELAFWDVSYAQHSRARVRSVRIKTHIWLILLIGFVLVVWVVTHSQHTRDTVNMHIFALYISAATVA